VERISSCRYEPGCPTSSGRTTSGAGIRISAFDGKPRKRLAPPESPALQLRTICQARAWHGKFQDKRYGAHFCAGLGDNAKEQQSRLLLDEALGIIEGYSPALARLMCRAGAQSAYEAASAESACLCRDQRRRKPNPAPAQRGGLRPCSSNSITKNLPHTVVCTVCG
jgi:hypothetical protein